MGDGVETTQVREFDVRRVARERPIRELIELFPATMAILAAHGMDLCCGGGHTVAEAARLHGLDADALVEQLVAAVRAEVGA